MVGPAKILISFTRIWGGVCLSVGSRFGMVGNGRPTVAGVLEKLWIFFSDKESSIPSSEKIMSALLSGKLSSYGDSPFFLFFNAFLHSKWRTMYTLARHQHGKQWLWFYRVSGMWELDWWSKRSYKVKPGKGNSKVSQVSRNFNYSYVSESCSFLKRRLHVRLQSYFSSLRCRKRI